MKIYLDNCATTKPYTKVVDKMKEVMEKNYANSSALHEFGFESEKIINEAAKIIGTSLGVSGKDIIFTSGATESSNMAIFGATRVSKRRGNHIITTKVEHPATRKVYDLLAEEYGYEVTFLPVDQDGVINLDDLRASLKDTTVLVSIMSVNNEVGSIMPVNEAARLVKEFNNLIFFHVDAVQGYLKYDYDVENIDLISVSAHKIHGPKGVGFLYKRRGVNIAPLILGGTHQNNMRAGTLNTEAIAGMGEAVRIGLLHKQEALEHFETIKSYFIQRLKEIDNIRVNGDPLKTSPHVCSVTFLNIRSEVLLHALEDEGIYVSAGSSCSSHSKKISGVLVNIGLTKEEAESTLRFSFSLFNTKEEIDQTISSLKVVVPMLRKFVRK